MSNQIDKNFSSNQGDLKLSPDLYEIIVDNNDSIDFDSFVKLLATSFNLTKNDATRIVLQIRASENFKFGPFTREISEMKLLALKENAESESLPLNCSMEKSISNVIK